MSSTNNMLIFKDESSFKDYVEKNPERCLLLYKNEVFDVSTFLSDHPGGSQIIEDCNGCDITEIFHNDYSHSHSDSAYKIFLNYRVGYIQNGKEDNNQAKFQHEVAYPKITETTIEYKDGFKVDRTKGLICQVLNMKKKDYIEMIHNPIVLDTCKLFDNYYLEEYTTKNNPIAIISIWLPFIFYLIYLSLMHDYGEQSSLYDRYINIYSPNFSILAVILAFLFGIFVWTKAEYSIHRWIFHFDPQCPDNSWALWLHFILHGIHHMVPMDKDRLVFPPVLGFIVLNIVFPIFNSLFSGALARLIFSGFGFAYICYDSFHYFSHHMTSQIEYFKEMKSYHNKHHYNKSNLGYGITNKFWDKVYGTEIKE